MAESSDLQILKYIVKNYYVFDSRQSLHLDPAAYIRDGIFKWNHGLKFAYNWKKWIL